MEGTFPSVATGNVKDESVGFVGSSDVENAISHHPHNVLDAGPSKGGGGKGDDGTAAEGSVTSGSDGTDEDASRDGGSAFSRRRASSNGKHCHLLLVGLFLAALAVGLGLGLGVGSSGSGSVSPGESSASVGANAGESTLPASNVTVGEEADDGGRNDPVPEDEQNGDGEPPTEGGVVATPSPVVATPSPTEETTEAGTQPGTDADEKTYPPKQVGQGGDLSTAFSEDATEWPQLVGMDGDQAAALLEGAYPGRYDIYVLHEESIVTMDLLYTRIRIFVNDANKVTLVPRVG
jgi:hypothetical protein